MVTLTFLTLTFKLVRARDQTRFSCEFGANPFNGSGDISYTYKKVTDSAKNRSLRSSLRVVINNITDLYLLPSSAEMTYNQLHTNQASMQGSTIYNRTQSQIQHKLARSLRCYIRLQALGLPQFRNFFNSKRNTTDAC